jgi:hypothetical protein
MQTYLRTAEVPRLARLLLGVIAAAWGALTFIHLYRFTLPTMDTWCYYAPAAFAERPFDLTRPLMGDFQSADQTWGIHWPGVLLFWSFVLPYLPGSAALDSGLFVLQWLLLALVTGAACHRMSRSIFPVFFSFLVILADRMIFESAMFQRHEIFSALVLIGVVYISWLPRDADPAFGLKFLRRIGYFALPLLHPIALGAGAALVLIELATERGVRRRRAVLDLFACCGGILFLVLYFGWTGSWSVFLAHAGQASGSHNFGRAFLKAFGQVYWPMPVIAVVYLWSAFVVVRTSIVSSRRFSKLTDEERTLLKICFLWLAVFLGIQVFYNPIYTILLLPLSLLVITPSLSDACRRWETSTVAIVLLLFFGMHGAFYLSRTEKYIRAGMPDLRGDLRIFAESLQKEPSLVPTCFWEIARAKKWNDAKLVAIPYAMAEEPRNAYRQELLSKLKPGGLIVVDELQEPDPDYGLLELLDVTARRTERKLMPGKVPWGYNLICYEILDGPKIRQLNTPE